MSVRQNTDWEYLYNVLKHIFLLEEKQSEPDIPLRFYDESFVLWSLRDVHFHFLSTLFGNGFLFLTSNSGEFQHLTGSKNRTLIHSSSGSQGVLHDLTNQEAATRNSFNLDQRKSNGGSSKVAPICFYPLCFYVPLLEAQSSYSSHSVNKYNHSSVEFLGEDFQFGMDLNSLVHVSEQTQDITSSNINHWVPRDFKRLEHFSNDVLSFRKTKTRFKPFYRSLLLDRYCTSIPLSQTSLISLLLHRLISKENASLTIPIVIYVNDESAEMFNWDSLFSESEKASKHDPNETDSIVFEESPKHRRLSSSKDPLDNSNESANEITLDHSTGSSDFLNLSPSKHYGELKVLPQERPVEGPTVTDVEFTKDFSRAAPDVTNTAEKRISNNPLLSHLNCSLFARTTHLCFFQTQALEKITQFELNSSESAMEKSQKLSSSPDNDLLHDPLLAFHKKGASSSNMNQRHNFYRTVLVKVPILPQEAFLSGAVTPLRWPINICSLSIGSFLWKILPEKVLQSCAVPNRDKVLVSKHSVFSNPRDIMLQVIETYGLVTATTRFDLIRSVPSFESSHILKDVYSVSPILARRSTAYDLMAIPGPLVSLEAAWNILDIWTTEMHPAFPSPSAASLESQMSTFHISFRTGAGKDSYLFWMWNDLLLLHRLYELREKLASSALGKNENELFETYLACDDTRELLQHPLHRETNTRPIETCHAEESSLFQRNSKKQDLTPVSENFPKGELLNHVMSFFKVQRRLGEGTVKRRVANTFSQLNMQQNTQTKKYMDIEKPDISTLDKTLYHEMNYSSHHNACAWNRMDRDFSDNLWLFLRRGFNVEDIYRAVQIILDAIGANFRQRNSGKSFDTSAEDPEPFLPLLHKGCVSKIASLINIAIKGSQLSRYNACFKQSQSDKPNVFLNDELNENNEISKIYNEWNQHRQKYCHPVACLDLLYELGVEVFYRDAIWLIQQADPSIPSSSLTWFHDSRIPFAEALARLSRLHKIAELAVLSRAVKLPWDPTRTLLRHALDSFRALPSPDDPGHHPLFVLNLSKQAFRTLINHWGRRESEMKFTLGLKNAVEAAFFRVTGDAELRELHKFHKIYPLNLNLFSNDMSEKDVQANSQYPLYLWKTHNRQFSQEFRDQKNEGDEQRLHESVPVKNYNPNEEIYYTLQLLYFDPLQDSQIIAL